MPNGSHLLGHPFTGWVSFDERIQAVKARKTTTSCLKLFFGNSSDAVIFTIVIHTVADFSLRQCWLTLLFDVGSAFGVCSNRLHFGWFPMVSLWRRPGGYVWASQLPPPWQQPEKERQVFMGTRFWNEAHPRTPSCISQKKCNVWRNHENPQRPEFQSSNLVQKPKLGQTHYSFQQKVNHSWLWLTKPLWPPPVHSHLSIDPTLFSPSPDKSWLTAKAMMEAAKPQLRSDFVHQASNL